MARSFLAELVIALRDGVSGPAKKIPGALKGVETAIDALNKKGGAPGLQKTTNDLTKMAQAARLLAAEGTKLGDIPISILNRIGKLKLPQAELEKFRDAYRQLSRDLQGADRSMRATALRNFANDFLLAAAGADRTAAAVRKLGLSAAQARREMSLLSDITRTMGYGGAAFATQRGLRFGAQAAGEYQREKFRQEMGGITAMDSAALQGRSMSLSGKYRSMDATDINTVGRSIYNMTGDMPKAIDLLEDFTRAFVVLQSVKGKEGATKELEDFSKAIDIFGRQEKPEEVRKILDAALKATQVEGRQLPLTEYMKLAKYAKAGGAALSPEFLGAIAPTLMQEEGGQRTGTALGSMVSQMIGRRMTKGAMNQQIGIGIRQRGSGDLVDPDLLMSNPYDWAQKHLGPAMQKEGFDPTASGNESKVVAFMSKIFSNQMVSGLFTKFFTQQDQIERNRNKLYPAAKGSAAADEAITKDPFVALEGVFAQLRNLFAILGDAGVTDAVVSGLNGLSSGISALNAALAGNSTAASITAGLLGVAGGLIALRAAVAVWRLMGLPGKLAAGAAGGAMGAMGAGGAAAAGAAGGAAAAGGSRMATLARGVRFVPGVGLVFGAASLGYGIYNGENDVAPGDLSEAGAIAQARAHRWRRPDPAVLNPMGGMQSPGSGANQFGLGGINPRIDVDSFDAAKTKAEETKASIEEIGETTARPKIDTAELERALMIITQMKAGLDGLGASAARVGSTVRSAYSDYGMGEGG